jgi:hypothetical protein
MEDIREGACPLCRHDEVIEATHPNEAVASESPFVASVVPGIFSDAPKRFGAFSAYICAGCGFTQ